MGERRGDAGSALMLVPAGVLVLVVLAGIAFDMSHAWLAQRELSTVAESVANDAAAAAIDQGALRGGGRLLVDQGVVDSIAADAVRHAPADLRSLEVVASVEPSTGEVTVTATARVDPVFLRALPDGVIPSVVHATAIARLVG